MFSLLLWLVLPSIGWFYIGIVFLASFLIDFDHYINAVFRTRSLSLFNAFEFYRKEMIRELREHKLGIRKKSTFQPFHTIEFHLLVLLLSCIHIIFIYVFIGMVFHSLLDFIQLCYEDMVYRREYFLTRWLANQIFRRS